ncbi:MAG: proton-conducting transporter membrane subunit, partial [bacterium]
MMILVPAVAALLAYVLGRLRAELSFIGSVLPLYFAVRLFLQSRHDVIVFTVLQRAGIQVAFRLDSLSGFVLLFTAIFGVLILLYSLRSMRGHPGARGFYVYSLLTLACAFGALLAANLLVLAFFWGCLLVLVYGLLLVSRGDGQPAATKALVIVGLSDFALLLGVALLVVRGGWIDLVPPVAMRLSEPSAILAFLLVAVGALAKAGSMPLHSWIPTASETSPATVMALVPASLDKLLGIYLLTRLSVYVFDISSNMTLRTVFMAVGSVTVLAAVMMALVQKRVMRLLAFHAVSQVGYMVIGIGTGVPVGIAGGLFHMLNHALYKTGLFLTAGSVYSQSKTDKIDELGGLAGKMPLTFATFLLCPLGQRAVGWDAEAVDGWIEQRIAEAEGHSFFHINRAASEVGLLP